MENSVTVAEAILTLPSLVKRARDCFQATTLIEDGQPVARLVPILRAKTGVEIAAAMAGDRPHLTVEEAEAFEADIREMRSQLASAVSPWD